MSNKCIIRFMGDVMIGRLVNNKIKEEGYKYPWGNILPYLKNPGVNIINLEAALTTSTKKASKVFNFKAEPDRINTLSEANIHVANIANNHILDYGVEGMIETIKMLDEAKIQHAGAGNNFEEARRPAIVECNGIKIGIIGCTDNEPDWRANKNPGVYYVKVGDITQLKEDISRVRDKVDILILSAHLGPNMVEVPSLEEIKFSHQLIDLGIDIIHGHSAHIFQGIELYKGKVIMYDTGDFIDDYQVDPDLRNDRSFLFECEITGNKITGMKFIPVFIDKMQVNFAKGEDAKWCIARMQYLSDNFGTRINDLGEVANYESH